MRLLFLILFLPFTLLSQSNYNLSLLGTYDNYNSEGNDIWGWVAPDGSEYALVGLNDGFSVVNVSNPSNPIEEFFINDLTSTWRDVKTWGNYAYVTTEADAGLLIVDLSDMTGNTYFHRTLFTAASSGADTEFTAAHNIYIDENGVAYIFGASSNTGSSPSDGVIFLDVDTDPINPLFLGEWDDFYVHDGMARGDTMYVGCIYEGDLYVVDVSDKANPVNLGNVGTPSDFTHNAWVSDNGNYVFTTDEVSDAYLGSYDISDLNNIQEIDRIQSNPGSNSIPHNTHVDGNFIITSYYRDGTVVHDITNPHNLIEVAHFDSSPLSGDGFDGCWGTYPFLPSGNIISSDINSGNNNNGRLLIYSRDFLQACYLEGNVSDITNSNPITNATVEILNSVLTVQTSTDLSGNYMTGIANSSSYDIVFSAPGYLSDTINATFSNGNTTIVNSQLQPLQSFNTSGSVIDVNGTGIPNSDVLIYNSSFSLNTITDANGNFNINGIYEGNYNIIAGSWGYITSCTNEFISSTTNNQITLQSGYYDDFTFDFGWTVTGGVSAPSDGIWQRGNPEGTDYNGSNFNPDNDVNNDCYEYAYVTGLAAGSQIGDNDVDDFNTILTSPVFDLSNQLTNDESYFLNYNLWFNNDFPSWGGGSNPNDSLTVKITNGVFTTTLETLTSNSSNLGQWNSKSFDLSQYISLNNTMQIIIETADWDALGGHWVEGGFDKFEIVVQSTTSQDDINLNSKKLIDVVDLIGRRSLPKNNNILLYIYDDGSVEKRVIIDKK